MTHIKFDMDVLSITDPSFGVSGIIHMDLIHGYAEGTSLDVGTQPNSFGYGGTGKKSTDCKFEDYGHPYRQVWHLIKGIPLPRN